ncbi:VRR-NUC domain-containing protein [Cyanophage S-2L]|nr:VRR-NUC domain-containing protein [Cyanophage S-2L]
MAQRETILQNWIRLEVAQAMAPHVVLFRNHNGSLPDPRTGGWITFGLGEGSPDLIGWRVLQIGALAQFVGLEVKLPGEKARPEQQTWIDNINAAGGLAGTVTSPEEAIALLSSPPYPFEVHHAPRNRRGPRPQDPLPEARPQASPALHARGPRRAPRSGEGPGPADPFG